MFPLLCVGLLTVSVFIYVSRPLSLGALIMTLSLILTCLLGMAVSSWWGFILFLIYVGALLVLFVYVMAMSPNCFFSRPEKSSLMTYILVVMMMLVFLLFLMFPEIQFSSFSASFLSTQKPILLDSFYNITCLISLSVVLLFVMVCVVELIPGKSQGAPLRPFN